MSFFKLAMTVLLKIHTANKIFSKICLKAIRYIFFQYVVCDQGRQGRQGVISKKRGKFKLLTLQRYPPIPSLSVTSYSLHKENWRVPGLLSKMILKRASDSIFFQSNEFTAWEVKDKKEVANSLMKFNLLKIIHPLQGKKHLRT